MIDPRQKTDMADELTAIARKSYGESAIFVKCCSGSPKFWFYLGRKLVSEHDAASHEEAFRELKIKLETMAMLTELQNAKETAKDAAETKRMVDEFAAQARRVYGPTAETEFSPLERTFIARIGGAIVIDGSGDTVREAFNIAMNRLVFAANDQITAAQRGAFLELVNRTYPGATTQINGRKFEFSVMQSGTPIVSETGATMLDAYNAVMARLRAVSVKAEEPDVPAMTPELGEAFVKFNALPALMNDVFGDDAHLIVREEQPYVTIESRIGKHTVFASSATATTPQAVSAAHAWLTSMKTNTPSFPSIDAEAKRAFGRGARFTPSGKAGYPSVIEGDKELLEWRDGTYTAQLHRALAHLLCLPSKTVAASEAMATQERTTGVSYEPNLDTMKARFRIEAMRVGGPTAKLETGANNIGYNVTLTFGDGASRKVMSETRGSERMAYESLVARLRAMPTFGAAETLRATAVDNAAADDLKAKLLTEAPATIHAQSNDERVLYLDGSSIVAASWDGTPLKISITNTTPEQKATPTMTPQTPAPTPILDTVKADAIASAWRLAGSQFVKLAKEPLVATLSRHLGPDDDSMRARIAAFLDTELGIALLSGVLSAGLSAMPTPPNSQAASINGQLARELRVRSMAATGDLIADVLMGPLRQVAVMYLSGDSSGPMGLPDGSGRIVVPANVAAEVAR